MNLSVRTSRTGLGAFLTKPVKAGGLIVDWTDHPLFAEPPRIREEWRFREVSPGVLIGPIGPEEYPDAYINHSCAPSAALRFDGSKIHLISLRDLPEGEEVTFDYSTLYRKPWTMKCDCGTAVCRRTIIGKTK